MKTVFDLSRDEIVAGSYEQFWIMKEGVCPAVKGET